MHLSGFNGMHTIHKQCTRMSSSSEYTLSFKHGLFCDTEMHKMGAAAELGLVTTPEEFIPRAGAVNLHTYVFGRSVNFAEVLIPLETFLLHLF